MKGVLIRPANDWELIDIADLDDIQDAVDGYFEILDLDLPDPDHDDTHYRMTMYINDSKLLGQWDVAKDFNRVASSFAYVGGRYAAILGPVLLMGGPNKKGDDTELNFPVVERWLKRIKRLNQGDKSVRAP